MPTAFSTHEVLNQSPDFSNINLFDSDPALVAAVEREGGASQVSSLQGFGALLGAAETIEKGRLANVHTPVLHSFDRKGRRSDQIEFHPAYHEFMAMSMTQGLHCGAWSHLADESAPVKGATVARTAGIYLMSQIEPGHTCPLVMTNAAVPALLQNKELAKNWLPKILSRDYDSSFRRMADKSAVTIGMGMTEKQGGTDVRANTSIAEPLGDGSYAITGHKWFMSAPMCDAFLVLAQAPGGLTCFLMPRVLDNGSVNALAFQRLKEKLGNRSNASSEVEFLGARSWRIGDEGRGVATILEMVTLTRLDCVVSSAGLMRWGLANAIHHVRHRTVFQKKLIDQPLMAAVLADMALDVEAATCLGFRLARAVERKDIDPNEAAYARIMTPVAKYWNCKMVPSLTNEAMECLGGNSYVEDGPMARLYREAPLNAIWEGSGNVMCLDFLRAATKDPESLERVFAQISASSGSNSLVNKALDRVRSIVGDASRMEVEARFAVEQLALAAASALMLNHAAEDSGDIFSDSRLAGQWRHTYGTFGGGGKSVDTRAIIDRALPA